MKKKKEPETAFESIFLGEFIEIVTKVMTKAQTESEEGVSLVETPVIIQGYLLDTDSHYLYLGQTAGEVTQALKKTQVLHVQIVPHQVFDPMDEILEQAEAPKSKKAYN